MKLANERTEALTFPDKIGLYIYYKRLMDISVSSVALSLTFSYNIDHLSSYTT